MWLGRLVGDIALSAARRFSARTVPVYAYALTAMAGAATRVPRPAQASMEQPGKPRRSPFTIWFGSIDLYVERHVMPDIEAGLIDRDFLSVVMAIRNWENDRHYAAWGLERIWERTA